MSSRQPVVTDGDHRVIPFRPRSLAKPSGLSPAVQQDNRASRTSRPAGLHLVRNVPDLEAAAPHGRSDDYRHRMLINIAALMFTLLLTAIGVWLATTLADMRRTQDCVLVGRRDCGKLPSLDKLVPPGAVDHI